ncbi:MAG: polysaccharide deacetylase family protein [Armatimonadota bacterium]|nr:polysaccharide deacetylase family protein [Armatimonadota bacterium]
MKSCPRCGTQTDTDGASCLHCYAPLDPVPTSPGPCEQTPALVRILRSRYCAYSCAGLALAAVYAGIVLSLCPTAPPVGTADLSQRVAPSAAARSMERQKMALKGPRSAKVAIAPKRVATKPPKKALVSGTRFTKHRETPESGTSASENKPKHQPPQIAERAAPTTVRPNIAAKKAAAKPAVVAKVSKKTPPAKPQSPMAAKRPAAKPARSAAEYRPRRYHGKVVRNRVRRFPDKVLALTFDDGPDRVVTPKVLRTLAKYKVRATFFIIGQHARERTDILRQVAAAGHAVESHSYSHPSRPSKAIAEQELVKTAALIRGATGRNPTCFRPPCGILDNALTRQALKDGYTVVNWTVTSADTSRRATPGMIAGNVIAKLKPGDIILVHDGPGHRKTAAALPIILQQAKKKGFRFVTVPELLNDWDRWLVACENTERQRKARLRMQAKLHPTQRRG